jgi:hypothetical protein
VRYAFRMTREGPSGIDLKLVASQPDKVNRPVSTGAASRSRSGAQSVADLVAPGLAPLLRMRGFANTALHAHWNQIVGERLAAFCVAERLKWPPRPAREDLSEMRRPATLMVRIEPAFALELSHQTALVIERANSFLGWRCIDRLVMTQGPVHSTPKDTPSPLRDLTAEEQAQLAQMTQPIKEDAVRQSLIRLGQGILRRKPKRTT